MESSASALTTDNRENALNFEQLRVLFETQLFNIGATIGIATIVASTMHTIVDTTQLLIWCGLMLLGNSIRAAIVIGWRFDANRQQRVSRWFRLAQLSAFLGGSGWGLCGPLLLTSHSESQQLLIAFVTCGVSSVGVVSLAVDRRFAWTFLLPCVIPLELKFLLSNTAALGFNIGAMGIVYLLFMAVVINRLHFYLKENIELRLAATERERKQSEIAQALHSSQVKLAALFDLSPLGCMLMRIDGSLVHANSAMSEMLGYQDDELADIYSAGLTAPEQVEENRTRWHRLVQTGGNDFLECDLIGKDGKRVPASVHRIVFDAGDGLNYVWAVVENISERRQYEKELRALNNRLELARQAGNIGIWELDFVNNNLYWDERLCQMYGIESVQGQSHSDTAASVIHPDDYEMVTNSYLVAMADPTLERHSVEYRVLLKDDQERWVKAAGLYLRNAEGQIEKIIGVAWDISELKRVERMKSEFVSMVSHELRTPLTSIRGSLGLVAKGIVGDLSAEAKDLVEIAYKNSERLSHLIDDILDIEKMESGKMRMEMQTQLLTPLIEHAIAANSGFAHNFSVALQHHIEINVAVTVDANRFMQIMANLISNAVKFSKEHSLVEVMVLDRQSHVRIEVRDRGRGIPESFRKHLFERFSQADASDSRLQNGSGLGLAITKSLVERMHGVVGFEARDGGGSIFYVELPSQSLS